MPKIRGIKPETWTDENFVELTPLARLLWIGLWNFACDNGHLQDKSKQIKMRVLPTDDVNCAELLHEIEDRGLIERANGWITIPNLSHHQKPHKRWWSTCDKPGCVLPEGASHAPANRGATVAPPKGNRGATADVDSEGDGDGELIKDVSATDAATPTGQLALVTNDRRDVEAICEHLADQVEATGSKRPAITAKWRTEARLMLDRDGRTEEQVHSCIRWLYTSTHPDALFWRPNVRAVPKLRAEYDRLRLLAERPGSRPTTTSRNSEFQAQQERAMERAIERERQMGLR